VTVDGLLQDLRIALRSLGRRPGFTAVALLTLALGTGVNTTVFSVLNRVVLRPLSFPDPDRLVAVSSDVEGGIRHGLSVGDAMQLKRTTATFVSVGWVERPHLTDPVVLTGPNSERIAGAWVSADFFRVLGVVPALGRPVR
jgi:putative ABC transport system permease protein